MRITKAITNFLKRNSLYKELVRIVPNRKPQTDPVCLSLAMRSLPHRLSLAKEKSKAKALFPIELRNPCAICCLWTATAPRMSSGVKPALNISYCDMEPKLSRTGCVIYAHAASLSLYLIEEPDSTINVMLAYPMMRRQGHDLLAPAFCIRA